MLTRKFGFAALLVSATVFAACEKKDGDIIIDTPPPAVTVTIAPKPVPPLSPGQTIQLVAVVANSTNTAVTWSVLSGTSATVDATGKVTASNTVTGVTTVQAASQADPNAKDVVTVTVQGATTGQVQVTIGAITQFGTIFPVNPANVFGLIDITSNVDVPAGTTGTLVVEAFNSTVTREFCRQQFSVGATGADASIEAVPVTIVCTVNTAQLDSAGLALLQNGTYQIRSRILNATGTQVAQATSQPLVFNNQDMLIMTVRTDSMTGPQSDQAGLSWRAGQVVVHIRPAIYTNTQSSPLGAITSMNTTASTSGPGASWYATAACTADNDTDGTADWIDATPACPVATSTVAAARVGTSNLWRAVFPTSSSIGAAGVGGVEDRAGLAIAPSGVITVSGNNFPICSAAQAALGNCIQTFSVNFPTTTPGTVPVPITAQNPLRVDNLAPRVTSFDITGGFLGCGTTTCYANNNFAFAQGTVTAGIAAQSTSSTAGYTNRDFGVDRQTTTFAVGTSAAFTAGTGFTSPFTNFGAASLSETTTSAANALCVAPCLPAYVARATAVDALGNDTIVYASTGGVATLSLGSAQTLGYDKTPPVVTSFAQDNTGGAAAFRSYANNSVDKDDDAMVITVTFVDTAGTLNAGPAGFPAGNGPITGSTSSVIRYNAAAPAGTSVGFTGLSCVPSGPVSSQCTYTIADATSATTAGYFVNSTNVVDATVPGGNLSATTTTTYLDDETAPAVAGVTAPSSIVGAAPVTFTADMSDNVELGDLLASVGYVQGYFATNPAACTTAAVSCGARQVLAAYGLPLTSAITGASVMYNPFMYSLETTAANLPAGDQAVAQSINFAVRDMAGMALRAPCPVPPTDNASFAVDSLADGSTDGWCLQRQNNNVAVNIAFATPAPASFTTIQPTMSSWAIDSLVVATALTPTYPSQLTPTGGSVLIRATAQGPQGTFLNPFDAVNFYVFDNQLQRWIQLPGTPSVRASDADVVGVRVWRFTLVVPATSWPIENTCPGPSNVAPAGASPSVGPAGCVQAIRNNESPIVAVGVNAGRGLRTAPVTLP